MFITAAARREARDPFDERPAPPGALGPLWALARLPLRYGQGPNVYRLLAAVYDPMTGALTVALDAFDFDDERTLDHSNEALIVIARVAGITGFW